MTSQLENIIGDESTCIAAPAISFQSGNAWDAVGAPASGLRVVWANRSGQRWERLPFAPEAELKTLSDFPALRGV